MKPVKCEIAELLQTLYQIICEHYLYNSILDVLKCHGLSKLNGNLSEICRESDQELFLESNHPDYLDIKN